ncbi:hypothetical protein AALC17_19150 [Oscillospiraceae bacterium 38-13]
MEALVSKSAGKQMGRSKSGYKPSKIAQKMFADLFGDAGANYRGIVDKKVYHLLSEGPNCRINSWNPSSVLWKFSILGVG